MFTRYLLASILVFSACKIQAQHQALRTTIAKIASSASGNVGVSVRLLETNDTLSYHDRQPYVLQSVFKFAIAMAVLHRIDQGKMQLEQPVFITKKELPENYSPLRDKHPGGNVNVSVKGLLTYMLVVSDNDACDILLKRLGGPHQLTSYVRQLGITKMAVRASEEQMHAA